ncbi:MAG: hypothetical protein R8M11_05985, partial [Gallionella sp.]
TSIVSVSSNATPITLPVSAANNSISGTVTLNPTSSTETIYVTAKQNVPPSVTVKFVAADDTTGDYTITLPADAPLFGPYTALLPIVFTAAQPGVAGIYTVEASANGYETQSSPEDISAGNATAQDFTLFP